MTAAGEIYAFVLTTSQISSAVTSWQLYNHSDPKLKQISFQKMFMFIFSQIVTKANVSKIFQLQFDGSSILLSCMSL